MSPISMDAVERRLGPALVRRADTATIPASDDGRAAIARRVGQRARQRRLTRAAGSIVVVVILVAAGLGWVRHGGDGGKVVTGPGAPAVQLPKVGLPGRGNQWSIAAYSPGRWESIYLLPAGTPVGTGPYTLLVAPDAAAHLSLPTSPGSTESARVRGAPATVIAITSDRPVAAVVWEIAPGVEALLGPAGAPADSYRMQNGPVITTTPPAVDPELAARLLAIARSVGPVRDAVWWDALQHGTPGSTKFDLGPAPVLAAPHGSTEVALVYPGGQVVEDLDAPRFAPRSVGVSFEPAALSQFSPAGARRVEVRGTQGFLVPPGSTPARPVRRGQLTWLEGKNRVTLSYPPGPSDQQMIALADALSVPTTAQWHARLYPTTLRLDLEPMPTDLFTQMLDGLIHASGTPLVPR